MSSSIEERSIRGGTLSPTSNSQAPAQITNSQWDHEEDSTQGSAAPPSSSSRQGLSGDTTNRPPRKHQQLQQPQHTRLHQPHGVSSIGPSYSTTSSVLSISSSPSHTGSNANQVVSLESPLPPMVQRGLGDRSNEKRKNAALEIEAIVKSLQEAHNFSMVHSVISVLSKDFCTSMNANYRKGGLVGLAATSIGLSQYSRDFLHVLLPPILHCFDDPEARVRYYACESLYNVSKVSRQAILVNFNQIFEGLTKLYADVDVDVKNGADLLCRLIKDVVTEANNFSIESFLPLLQNYIRRTNPFIRQLIVGWITLLDAIPDINMLDYLPDFMDGLFNMLGDSNREIRQAADAALAEFLREVTASTVVEFGPMVGILVLQCQNRERLNRLTAMTWIAELIHHPHSGGDALLPYHSDLLYAVLCCISDGEADIRIVAETTNNNLLSLVKETSASFELKPLLDMLTNELLIKDDVPTKMAALGWINMLMEKLKVDMNEFTEPLLPVLLRTLSDPSDVVVLLDLQVLSRISLAHRNELGIVQEAKETQFQIVLNAILNLFAQDRQLLETRGSLIIRKLCVLLNAKAVYIRMADTLSSFEEQADAATLQFISTMVQTLNLILLTASELHDLRTTLAGSFQRQWRTRSDETVQVFSNIFHCWCHNPVATFTLCLLAQAYDLSFALVKRFAEMEDVSVGFLMQMDKLVHLLESPIFVHLRLQLLDVEAPYHAPLLKSIYGILMCLPQGSTFRLLNERLTAVCNLRDNLGIQSSSPEKVFLESSSTNRLGLDMELLLTRYDKIVDKHLHAKHSSSSPLIIMPLTNAKSTVSSSSSSSTFGTTRNGSITPRKAISSSQLPPTDTSPFRPSSMRSRLLAARAKQDSSAAANAKRLQSKIPGSP